MKKNYYFVETSALNKVSGENIIISSNSIKNLECLDYGHISIEKIIKNDIPVYIFKKSMLNEIKKLDIPTKGAEDLAAAIHYDKNIHPDETVFVTSNYYLSIIANLYFGEDSIIYIPPKGRRRNLNGNATIDI